METGVYQIEFKNGRIFRIFYTTSRQHKKIINYYYANIDKIKTFSPIVNGIHTVKQFEQILKTL